MQGSYNPTPTNRDQYGPIYPWTIVGYGDGTWQAFNLHTSEELGRRERYSEAVLDAYAALKESRNA